MLNFVIQRATQMCLATPSLHRQLAKMLLLYRAAVVTAVVTATADSGNVGFCLDYQKK